MAIDFEALLQTFLAEARDNLETMEADLLALERNPDDPDRLHDVFRLAHTLKGDAASLGFPRLSGYAHRLEDHLETVRAGSGRLSPEAISLLLEAVDVLRARLRRAAAGAEGNPEEERPEEERPIARLARLLGGDAEAPESRLTVEPQGSRSVAPAGQVTGRWPILSAAPLAAGSSTDASVAASPVPEPAPARPTLRVAIERLDELVDRVGEMRIARGRIANLLGREEVPRREILELHGEHDRLFDQLQRLVLDLRMVPIGPVFRTLDRTVRDLSARRGKEIRLVYVGEEVEVDAGLAEHLRAPLAHLARNAVDHGIETPQERRASGKPPAGCLRVSAHRDGNSLVVEIADDGRGLDRAKIAARAKATGIAQDLDPSEFDRLVLLPGFSTAEAVDEASGRGVGLDVVRRAIESLRGRVDLESRDGEGTTVRLRLPLSLGLLDGLAVAVGGETYIVPLEAVDEVIDRPVGADVSAGVVALRGEAVSYLRLRDLLAVPGAEAEREQILVLAPRAPGGPRSAGRIGVAVDELLGREQIVIRPLAPQLEELPGLSGSAILGSGEVAFVLDFTSLLQTSARVATGV